MKVRLISCLALVAISPFLQADDSLYCPQNHAYISVGMSTDQVISACGEPVSKKESDLPLIQKVPVQQLIYNHKGTSTGFYGVWNIPTGNGGTSLKIDIVNNKVKSIQLDGSDSNAVSICGSTSIQEGDAVGKVYGACGNPSLVNSSFLKEAVPTASKPQIWIYQPGQYQQPVNLTFVDGKLQSIN